jgi:hypothetical protein
MASQMHEMALLKGMQWTIMWALLYKTVGWISINVHLSSDLGNYAFTISK